MKYETFVEKFKDLLISEKVAIFNKYCLEYGDSDNMLNSFDEEFFEMAFSNPMEAARATFFGDIKNWSDEYIRFDGRGNLEFVNAYNVYEEIEGYLEEIFEHEKTWEDYIEDDDYTEVRNNFDNGEGYTTIDAWKTNDPNEEGEVVAVVNNTTKEVYYIEPSARFSKRVQEAINEIDNEDDEDEESNENDVEHKEEE